MSDTENAERDFEFEAFVSGYLRWIRHRLRKRVSVANAVLLDFDQLENDIQFEFAMRLQATNWQTLTRLEGFGMLWRIVDSRIINAINFEKRTKRSRSQFNGKRIDCEGRRDRFSRRASCNPLHGGSKLFMCFRYTMGNKFLRNFKNVDADAGVSGNEEKTDC